jgi:hypothetical protein
MILVAFVSDQFVRKPFPIDRDRSQLIGISLEGRFAPTALFKPRHFIEVPVSSQGYVLYLFNMLQTQREVGQFHLSIGMITILLWCIDHQLLLITNPIVGVMVSALVLSGVDRGFDPRLGQTKYYKIGC